MGGYVDLSIPSAGTTIIVLGQAQDLLSQCPLGGFSPVEWITNFMSPPQDILCNLHFSMPSEWTATVSLPPSSTEVNLHAWVLFTQLSLENSFPVRLWKELHLKDPPLLKCGFGKAHLIVILIDLQVKFMKKFSS